MTRRRERAHKRAHEIHDAFLTGSGGGCKQKRPLRLYVAWSDELCFSKVGVARDTKARLKGIQTGSPVRLLVGDRPRWVFESDDHTRAAEKLVHLLLDRFRSQGEWFRCRSSCAAKACDLVHSFVSSGQMSESGWLRVEQRFQEYCRHRSLPDARSVSVEAQLARLGRLCAQLPFRANLSEAAA